MAAFSTPSVGRKPRSNHLACYHRSPSLVRYAPGKCPGSDRTLLVTRFLYSGSPPTQRKSSFTGAMFDTLPLYCLCEKYRIWPIIHTSRSPQNHPTLFSVFSSFYIPVLSWPAPATALTRPAAAGGASHVTRVAALWRDPAQSSHAIAAGKNET